IKTAYKQESKRGLNLSITKPRNPEWLANNLTNPFRDWDGRENITAAQGFAIDLAPLFERFDQLRDF
ncbi:hypothetical protein EN829_058870, partial [Mesorhizobium sp. M00.F.Ca.ET.186.01.1.1]